MAQVNFRIDDNVKQEADELFDNLGVSLSAGSRQKQDYSGIAARIPDYKGRGERAAMPE